MSEPDRANASDSLPSLPIERDLTGQSLGDFRVIRKLGQGGMGEVYLAEQTSLGRRVAIKVLRKDLANDGNYLRRFEAEARAVAPISHPNIVAVIAIGESANVHYIAMEYVQGINLREYIAKKGPLEVPICLSFMRKIASALQRASEHSIVHRDIKPENVLLTRRGDVKVADFGLARQLTEQNVAITQSGMTMGTPLYMSPEQIHGKRADHRSDLYSFGVTSYHMLAGSPPYRGDTAMAVALQHLQGRPSPLQELRADAPPELIRIIAKLMALEPDDRYQTAKEALRDLNALRMGQSVIERAEPFITPVGSNATRTILDSSPSKSADGAGRWAGLRRALMTPGRRKWTIAACLLAALLVGAAMGKSGRFDQLLKIDEIRSPERPSTAAIKPLDSGWSQLRYARSVLPTYQREAGLWAVIEFHKGDEEDSVAAALELFQGYLSERDVALAHRLADFLIDRDADMQKFFGYYFRGVIYSYEGKASESNESFILMLRCRQRIPLPAEDLEWIAREYFLSLHRNFAILNKPRDDEMAKSFWTKFMPPPQRPPGRP